MGKSKNIINLKQERNIQEKYNNKKIINNIYNKVIDKELNKIEKQKGN